MNELVRTRSSAAMVAVHLLPIALGLSIVGCSKSWPKNVEELSGAWPIPAAEARALKALAKASKLDPQQFHLWNDGQQLTARRGARIRAGHVSELHLPDSGLRSLAAVAKLPELTQINVNRNPLSALEGIAKLSQLRYLRAGRNPIIRVDRLDALVKLLVLDLTETRLESLDRLGKIPVKLTIFLGGKLPKLNVEAGAGPAGLILYSPASPLDTSGLRTQKKLIYLRVQKPPGPLHLDDLCATKALQELKMSDTAQVSLAGLAGCSALKKLELSSCEKLDLATLPSLPALEHLELFNSKMGNLPLPLLPALKKLTVRAPRKLTSLAGLDGANLPKLRSVWLGRGQFPSLDVRGSFKAMRELVIDHGELSSLRGLIAFPRLTTLDVSYSKVASLGRELAEAPANSAPAEAPAPSAEGTRSKKSPSKKKRAIAAEATSRPAPVCAYLHTIRAQHNKIASVVGLSTVAPALRQLTIDYNALTTLRGLEGAKKLRFLDVSHNRLTTLAALQGVALLSLQAYLNKLTSAAPVVVKGKRLGSLTYLDLRNNPLRDLPVSQRYYNQSAGQSMRSSTRYQSGGGYRSGK